jgi:hypothetical protein
MSLAARSQALFVRVGATADFFAISAGNGGLLRRMTLRVSRVGQRRCRAHMCLPRIWGRSRVDDPDAHVLF